MADPATSYYNNFASFLSTFRIRLAAIWPVFSGLPPMGIVQFCSGPLDRVSETDSQLRPALGILQARDAWVPWRFLELQPRKQHPGDRGRGGNPSDFGLKARYKNFAPRLGGAYRLNEKTVIRAGFGISYTPFPDNTYAYNYPIRANNQFDPAIATYGPAVLPNGQPATFQNGFPAPINPAIPANGIITNPPVAQAYNVINPNFKHPYVESWNFAVQRQLPLNLVLDVAYVANHGVDTGGAYNLNAATTAGGGNASLPEFASFGRTASTTLYFAGYSNSYNSLQVKLDRRFSRGLTLTTAYTYGKGLGYQTGDDGGLYFYVNQRRNYARNDFDRTHTFVQSYVYDLPFGAGKKFLSSGFLSNVLGGWRVNGILTLMTGIPFNVTGGSALNTPGSTQTADQVAPVTYPHGINIGNPWFSPTSFVPETQPGVFGNSGRNALTGPGFFDLDASLFKVFRYKERYSLEVRGEFFGVTNTPQFSNPNSNASNYSSDPTKNTFGVITGVGGGGRTGQLGMKLIF